VHVFNIILHKPIHAGYVLGKKMVLELVFFSVVCFSLSDLFHYCSIFITLIPTLYKRRNLRDLLNNALTLTPYFQHFRKFCILLV